MKINAYILAADPAWIESSVLSYYSLVERIVVSYDEDGFSWTGAPLDIDQCLQRLRTIDLDGKLDFCPGHYARREFYSRPLENDTYQRQCALDQAGSDADWVLQLDTDEIIGDAATFADCLLEAHRAERMALNYPMLWLYCQASADSYLEWCDRGWRRTPGYPGPVAVRVGSRLTLARRVEEGHFHVDLSRWGSRVRVPNGIKVDRVISADQAVWHLSMLRDEWWLRRKFMSSGHAHERNWHEEVDDWLWARRHPLLKSFISQFGRGPYKRPLRLSRMPAAVTALAAASREGRTTPTKKEVVLT